MTTQSRSLRLADQLVHTPTLSPAATRYSLSPATAICSKCCSTERESIGTTTGSDGWCVSDLDINYEDTELTCAHHGSLIEAAYV